MCDLASLQDEIAAELPADTLGGEDAWPLTARAAQVRPTPPSSLVFLGEAIGWVP